MRVTTDGVFKIAIEETGTKEAEWPFYATKIISCGYLELLHSAITCTMPWQQISPRDEERRHFELACKVAATESNLDPYGEYLVKSPASDSMDASEKSAGAYCVGLILTKLLAAREFGADYFLPALLLTSRNLDESYMTGARKWPSCVGWKRDAGWSVWEPVGRRDRAPKALDDAFNRVLAVKTVNGSAPLYAAACMTYFDTKSGELQGIVRNAPLGKKADITVSLDSLLELYYRPVCELFDEALKRRPFDDFLDYREGFMEIDIDIFKGRGVKLGVPKDILGYFKYHDNRDKSGLKISSVVSSLSRLVPKRVTEPGFYMGSDGVYVRLP